MSLLLRRRGMMLTPDTAPVVWDYGWDYTMGAPDKSLWDYPIGDGTAAWNYDADNGLQLSCALNHYAALRLINQAHYFSQKGVLEVVLNISKTLTHGIRILLASGNPGVSDGKGLQLTVNGNYLNVLRTNAELTTLTQTVPITYNTWHTVRLELDIPANANKVYLDGALVDTVANADLSTISAGNTWCLAQTGDFYLRAMRFKKEDVT